MSLTFLGGGSGNGGGVTPTQARAISRDTDPVDVGRTVKFNGAGKAVITLGAAGTFDAGYVEAPGAFRDKAGNVRLTWTGYSEATNSPTTVASIGIATVRSGGGVTRDGQLFAASGIPGSPDEKGVTGWQVILVGDTYYAFYIGLTAIGYEGGDRSICVATSSDLATWTRHGAIITKSADPNSWYWYAVWRPHVIRVNGTWYCLFNASGKVGSRNNVETIGFATADTDDLTGDWTVDPTPVLDTINPTDTVAGDPWPWHSGNGRIRTEAYRADSTFTTIGAYYADCAEDDFPRGLTWRSQVTSAAANQGAKPAVIRVDDELYYFASFGVNIFLNIVPSVLDTDRLMRGRHRAAPDQSASGAPSFYVGDDLNLNLSTGYRWLSIGSTTSNSGLWFGQSNSRLLGVYWQYSATAASAIAKLETFGGSNPIQIQNNAGALLLGGGSGTLGFRGTTPIAKQTLAVAATDAATTQTLANDIRSKLIALGLMA